VHHECLVHWSLQGEDWRFRAEDGTLATTGRTTLAVDDARFLREAAAAGLGIAVIPELLVREELASGRLIQVLEHTTALEIGVYALHPHAHLAPANVRAFVEHVVEYFRKAAKPVPRSPPTKPTKTKTSAKGVAMTEQDVERLRLVSSLYEEIEPEGAARLAEIVAGARVLPAAKIPRTTATMNSRVHLRDGRDEEREVSLVYPWDTRRDGVSVVSALGGQLLGASVGATLRDDDTKLRLTAIDYQPEAAGDHHL
jgi:transcription elongation GreA/GreB family factor